MDKKAAADMIETIMVLVVVIILLVIGLVFYFRTSMQGIEETGKEVCQLSGNDLLVAMTALPELQCSVDTVAKDCIDIEKAQAFKKVLADKTAKKYYDTYFSGTCPKKVSLELVYPQPEANKECQPGDEIGKCKSWVVYSPAGLSKNKQLISTPVSLYSMGKSYIGRMVVEVNR